MPKTTLYYFDGKALGESIRLLIGGQEFEDRRIKYKDWATYKPQMPFQGMPVIEIEGKKLSNSMTIASYLGHKYGLAGSTLEEDLETNQNIFFFIDLREVARGVHHETDEEVIKRKHEENVNNEYLFRLSKLDEIIKSNNGQIAAGKLLNAI